MNSISVLAVFVLLASSLHVFGNSPLSTKALTFVPEGKVILEKNKEVKVQTPAGSIVEVEFEVDGSFEEASGDDLTKDVFTPDGKLLSLKDVLEKVKAQGKSPMGGWSLEKSFVKGWHYEFEGIENGLEMDYLVDAKTGKILESKADD